MNENDPFSRCSKYPTSSYYNDARDVLETAYPHCTSFLRYHLRPTIAGLCRRKCGVAMVIDSTIPTALDRFRQVCYRLEDSVPWDRFSFDVYDFAGVADMLPMLAVHGSIRGIGELFWVERGEIIGAMTGELDQSRFDELTIRLHGK